MAFCTVLVHIIHGRNFIFPYGFAVVIIVNIIIIVVVVVAVIFPVVAAVVGGLNSILTAHEFDYSSFTGSGMEMNAKWRHNAANVDMAINTPMLVLSHLPKQKVARKCWGKYE
jgi:hypothetical protein